MASSTRRDSRAQTEWCGEDDLAADVFTPEQRVVSAWGGWSRVRHPTRQVEVGLHEGRPFLALEWVEGGTLAELLKRQPMAPRQAAELVEMLARATHAAHAQGVLHRDLKPANILLQRSEVRSQKSDGAQASAPLSDLCPPTSDLCPKIADFGLAKHLKADEALTATGVVVGTAEYMAPEQASARSHELGPAVDVYALGACLYEMLTGRPPFRAATPWETLQQVVLLDPIPLRRLRSEIPRTGRFVSNAAGTWSALSRPWLAEDLQHFLVGERAGLRPTGR